jgi:LysM repeat protein
MGSGNRTVVKYMQQPLYYGWNFKMINLRYPGKSHFGIGMDAGVRLAANSGFKTALVLSDVMLGMGQSLTTITLGNSYQLKDTTLLADLKARGPYSELFFGVEQSLFNGLLQARGGKGMALDGGHYLALGLGVNMLPWTIDMAWSIPWAGYHENSGYYGFNVGYRFGGKSYSEKFVGDASREAETLRTQIDDLRVQRSNLENAISTAKVNKGIVETDMTVMQGRMREMEQNLQDLQAQVLEQQYRKENPKPVKKYVPPPAPEKWPKLHKTEAGETLRSIASRYYGNPSLWERIYEANEKNISKGLPVEGSILTIPPPPVKEK